MPLYQGPRGRQASSWGRPLPSGKRLWRKARKVQGSFPPVGTLAALPHMMRSRRENVSVLPPDSLGSMKQKLSKGVSMCCGPQQGSAGQASLEICKGRRIVWALRNSFDGQRLEKEPLA